MKIKTLILAFLLLGVFAYAQNCDEKTVVLESGFDEVVIHRVIRTADNQFILAGQKNTDALVVKMDACGNVLWERTHAFGTEAAFRDIIEVNNRLVAMGYCEQCRLNDNARKLLIHELTSEGMLLGFVKTIGPTNADTDAWRMRPLSNGRFGVVGSRVITQGNVSGTGMTAYILSPELNTEQATFYNLLKLNETAYDIVEIPGQGYVITGGSMQTSPTTSAMIRIIGTDASLSQIWKQELHDAPTDKEQAGRALRRLPNGDLLLVGSRAVGANNQQLYAATLNPTNGNIKNEASFGGSGDDLGRDVFVIDSDHLFVTGMRSEAGFNDNPWSLILDANLSIRSEFQLPQQGFFNSGLSFMENGKRHYTMAGTLFSFPFKGIWTRTSDLATSTDGTPTPQPELRIYPNPALDHLMLDGWETLPAHTTAQLFSINGHLVMEKPATPRLELPILPAGTYLLRLSWGDTHWQTQILLLDRP
jgi:hypothetical protein